MLARVRSVSLLWAARCGWPHHSVPPFALTPRPQSAAVQQTLDCPIQATQLALRSRWRGPSENNPVSGSLCRSSTQSLLGTMLDRFMAFHRHRSHQLPVSLGSTRPYRVCVASLIGRQFYGLSFRLQLLSTPCRQDAVTLHSWREAPPQRDFHPPMHAHSQAHPRSASRRPPLACAKRFRSKHLGAARTLAVIGVHLDFKVAGRVTPCAPPRQAGDRPCHKVARRF